MIYVNLFLLILIVCFFIDVSGIMIDIKKFILKRILKLKSNDISALRIKPFDCSLCMCFWSGVIYLLYAGQFNIKSLAVVSFLSMISSNISGFMIYIKELLTFIENKLYDIIE